jgi:hypothetical protein
MRYRKDLKTRKIHKNRILILCEGKTEKVYLEGLRRSFPRQFQRDISLEITQADHSEPVTAIKELVTKLKKARLEMQPFTESWLVFDDDNRNLNVVFQELEKRKINYVYNSIAIEFWFLLHYKDNSRQFENANAVIKELEKYTGPFSKTDQELWNKLKANYQIAKQRAVKLRNKHKTNGSFLPNCKPYTNMDILVDKLNNLLNNTA